MTTPASRIALAVCLVWAAGVIGCLALRRWLTRAWIRIRWGRVMDCGP